MKTRLLLGALGLASMGIGTSILLTDPYIRRPVTVVWWLAGAVALHDGLLVPLVLGIGALLRPRGALRAGLVTAACVTLVALPVLVAPPAANPTVRPLDYPRGLLVALAAVAVATAVAWGWTAARHRRTTRREGTARRASRRRES
jgi:hypothetical protein